MGKTKKGINPDKWYTLTDIVKMNALPWCGKGIRRYRRFIDADSKGDNYLKAIIIGEGRTTRYSFQGKNIINLYNAVDTGVVRF